MPAASPTLLTFALNGHSFENFARRPVIGWVTGVNLADLGKARPKIFDGTTGNVYEDGALVMHITLPDNKFADLNILNIFEQGTGDVITLCMMVSVPRMLTSTENSKIWLNISGNMPSILVCRL
jgi:hypothetical protein